MRLVSALYLFGFVLSLNSLYAKTPELVPQYKIISDEFDESIPAGKCLVTGVVLHEGQSINEANIQSYFYDGYNTEASIAVNSNKLGKYRMLLDTAIYYYTVAKSGLGYAYVEGVKFKSQHKMEIEVYVPSEDEMIMVEKPVVYLYNDGEPIDAKVQIDTDLEMVFSYPILKEHNVWDVRVGQDGIHLPQGKKYPYLFWEAQTQGTDVYYTKGEGLILGQIIKTDTVISYLEHKLLSLHLNSTEVTDFITYWGPRIQQKEYALIQFKVDEEVNEIAELKIAPQPDWMRRVYMLFTGFDKEPQIKVLDVTLDEGLEKRQGFHVLEWGGAEVSLEILKTQL